MNSRVTGGKAIAAWNKFLSRRSFASALCTVIAVLSVTVTANAQDKKAAAPEAKQILVFSPDTRGGVSDQIADDILSVVKARLTATKLYEPIQFSASIPTIKLAVAERQLAPSDVKKPFDSDSKLKKLSGVSGYSLVIVSSIDDYQYDSAKNQVSVVLSIRLVDYSGAKAVVRSAGQSAASPASNGNVPELKIATDLIRGLTDKVMTAILTPKPTTPAK